MRFIMKFKKSYKNKQQSKWIKKLAHYQKKQHKMSEKKKKNLNTPLWCSRTLNFNLHMQGEEGKSHTNQGDKSNNNVKIVTTMW